MNIVLNALYAFIATMCFCILFRCPRRAILFAGFCGMLSWGIYMTAYTFSKSSVGATFAGALAASIASQIIARTKKMPITITHLPGIIPLVPGAGLYYTMIHLLQGNYSLAVYKGTETLLIAVAIANAVIITATMFKLIYGISRRRKKSKIKEMNR